MKTIIVRALIVIACIAALTSGYVFHVLLAVLVVSKGEPIPRYTVARSALLVIDIQDGTTGGSSHSSSLVKQSAALIGTVNAITARAQKLNMPVIYIRHEYTDRVFNFITMGMLATGTKSVELDKRLNVVSPNIFVKYKSDAFSNPELDAFLRKNEISHIYVTGLDAEYCVHKTILGALNRGYNVTVIHDAVITANTAKKDMLLQQYVKEGAVLASSEKFQQ